MSEDAKQLPLPIKLQDQAVFASFYPGANAEVVAHLRKPLNSSGEIIWIWGKSAIGKSHLLQAACTEHAESAYLPCREIVTIGPQMLHGFDRYPLLCLDDIDVLAGTAVWDQALFRLFNKLVSEQHATLLVSSTCAPQSLQFELPDLTSRLLSGPVFRLSSLNDDERLAAIQLRARRRGLELPTLTGRFLLKHFKRDMRSLCDALDKLDTASLVYQRRLTISLVKATLLEDTE